MILFMKVPIQKILFSLFASPLNSLIVAPLDFSRTTCCQVLRGPRAREVWTRQPDTHQACMEQWSIRMLGCSQGCMMLECAQG